MACDGRRCRSRSGGYSVSLQSALRRHLHESRRVVSQTRFRDLLGSGTEAHLLRGRERSRSTLQSEEYRQPANTPAGRLRSLWTHFERHGVTVSTEPFSDPVKELKQAFRS